MQHKLLTVLLLIVLIPALAFAGGKIRGKVVDKDTEEPLVGANVVVVGTSMGAATNIAGEFTILNVPAGTYTMRATYVGYQTITVSNIRVNNDLITDANFRLPSEGVTVQAVEIVAERPLVNKSATNAVRIVDSEFWEKLPARGVNNAIAIQPGVVTLGGNIYIRGGRPDEVGYSVDGVTTTDVVNGGNSLYTTAEAVEQLQVQAGGFSAEFGNANAGLIQSQLRIGSPERWKGTLIAETDNYTKQNKEALGGYSYGYSDVTVTAGGPLLSRKIRMFGSIQNTFFRDASVATRDPYQLKNLVTDPVITPLHGQRRDTLALLDVGANAIGGMNNRYAFSGTMLFDLNNLQAKLSGSYSTTESRDNTYIANILNTRRLTLRQAKNGFGSLKLSYIFNPTTYLEATGLYSAVSGKFMDPDFKDNLALYGDTTANKALGYNLYKQGVNYTSYSFYNNALIQRVNQPGAQIAGYGKNKTTSVGGRLDFTSQIKTHEVKVGAEFQRYTVTRYNPAGVIGWASLFAQATSQAELENLLNKSSGVGSDIIGYDILGNEIDADVSRNGGTLYFGPRHPVFLGVYAQDRIEFADVILNVGLRWDYIDPNSVSTDDPGNLTFNSEDYLLTSEYQNTPKTSQVSPRIGFSFPVTDRTVFHAQYGKFIQQTRLQDSYRGAAQMSGNIKGGLWNAGANGWGLKPTRTTQYELGFTQQISDNASFDITAFYKNIQDQIQFTMIAPEPGSEAPIYASMGNGDFSTSKGIEIKLILRRTSRLQAQVNYTFMDSRSTATNQGSSNGIWQLGLGPNSLPKYVMPTDFDFPHKGTILLDYRFGRNDGGPVLSQLGLNLLLNFNSGHAFTRLSSGNPGNTTDARFRDALEPPGSSSTPWFFQLDGRLDKTVPIGPLEVNFFVYVINLLGTDNPTNAFFRTGDPAEDGWIATEAGQLNAATLGQQWVNDYRAVGLGANSGNYGPPRQIRFGVRVDL